MNQNWFWPLTSNNGYFDVVKLLSPKINPIIAHQNCVAPRSSIGISAEDSGAQRIRIRIS
jgi:hypothetical protein